MSPVYFEHGSAFNTFAFGYVFSCLHELIRVRCYLRQTTSTPERLACKAHHPG